MQAGAQVQTDMYHFLTDNDYPRNNNVRPSTWREAVMALCGKMATHPTSVSSAHLFRLEINIVDWQGVGQSVSTIIVCDNLL